MLDLETKNAIIRHGVEIDDMIRDGRAYLDNLENQRRNLMTSWQRMPDHAKRMRQLEYDIADTRKVLDGLRAAVATLNHAAGVIEV